MNGLESLTKQFSKINLEKVQDYAKNLRYPLEASARTALYFLPALSTQTFLGRSKDPKFKEYKNKFSLVNYFKEVKKLYEQDAENIKLKRYLAPERMLPNLKDYTSLNFKNALELFNVKERIQKKKTKIIDDKISLDDFPSYYLESFHHQNDGYLSEDSAKLYDHQVETVFTGTAEAMRRHGIKALHELNSHHFPNDEKLKILDIGCGTGAFAYELKRHFPMSKVTGLDLSPWYLKEAEIQHPEAGIEWVFGKAEKLPFEDNSFDIVSSVFLFHELPEEIRAKAAQEMLRVLKKGGSLVHIDSLQNNDVPHLDSSLEIFPHLYHEPYYTNYISQKTEKLFEDMGLQNPQKDFAFYSKIVSGKKA